MSKPYHVVLTDFIRDDLGPERQVLSEAAEVSALGARTEEELAGRIEDVDAMVVFHEVIISRRTIERSNPVVGLVDWRLPGDQLSR